MTRVGLDNSQLKRRLFVFQPDYLANKNITSSTPRSFSRLGFVKYKPEKAEQTQHIHPVPETWWFNGRTLSSLERQISLTGIESLLIRQMLFNEQRVSSKVELILAINRDPECYRGLEMCMSRLQDKFSVAANGERLIRSVRNRGYCLVQKVQVIR
jgi:DNA-binding response OmpR family regulator